MRLAVVAVFADQAGEVQIGRFQLQPRFFPRFAAGAGIRRFADALV